MFYIYFLVTRPNSTIIIFWGMTSWVNATIAPLIGATCSSADTTSYDNIIATCTIIFTTIAAMRHSFLRLKKQIVATIYSLFDSYKSMAS